MTDDPLDRLRALCLTYTEVTERITSTTLDFYSHALPNRNKELASTIDATFGVAK